MPFATFAALGQITGNPPLSGGGYLTQNRGLSIPKASASQDGYLSSGDFAALSGGMGGGGGGSVTFAALSLPSVLFNTGAPITSSGTLSGTFISGARNLFLSTPTGASGTPTLRALDPLDLPASVEVTGHKDQPNGYAGLDSNGNINATITFRQGTYSSLSSTVLATGQPGYATDSGRFAVGDGNSTFANLPGFQAPSNTGILNLLGGGVVEGYTNNSANNGSFNVGGVYAGGSGALANKQYQWVRSAGSFSGIGDSQYSQTYLRFLTTNAGGNNLTLNGQSFNVSAVEGVSNYFIVASGKTYGCHLSCTARAQNGTSAFFMRQFVIKNVGGTVSLEGNVQTIGTDINPSGWGVGISALDTFKSLLITCTGQATTNIRWNATINATEVFY